MVIVYIVVKNVHFKGCQLIYDANMLELYDIKKIEQDIRWINLIVSCLLQVLLQTTLVDFEFKLWSCGEESIYQMTTAVDKNTFIRYSTPAICCRQL